MNNSDSPSLVQGSSTTVTPYQLTSSATAGTGQCNH
jgi:hypothetical protein